MVSTLSLQSVPNQDEGYDAASLSVTKDATDFFNELLPGTYPITSCELRTFSSCSSAYAGNKFTIGVTSPWAIQIDKNYPLGYSEKVCVRCQTSIQTLDFVNWQFSIVATMGTVAGALNPY